MPHRDIGWRPDVGVESYNGHEVWDHCAGQYQIHEEDEFDEPEEISFDWDELDTLVDPPEEE